MKSATQPSTDAREAYLVHCELTKLLHLSLDASIHEPLPSNIALLLVRLAFAEGVRNVAEQEDQESGDRGISPIRRG
jgi:hypothetical protein